MTEPENNTDEAEPDYRFTLANERTYLSWIRTALALIAGGVGLSALESILGPDWPLAREVGLIATVLGGLLPLVAYQHWRKVQQAMRRGEPLPVQRAAILLAVGMVVLAAGLALVILL
ncbi:MAG: hypothetical protein CMH41_09825 [Micrococcales bacterium]|nr:hypothetical protein [Micrococcales bacterium]